MSTTQTHLSFSPTTAPCRSTSTTRAAGGAATALILHGVKASLVEQSDGEDENGRWSCSEPRCEIDSAFDDALSQRRRGERRAHAAPRGHLGIDPAALGD